MALIVTTFAERFFSVLFQIFETQTVANIVEEKKYPSLALTEIAFVFRCATTKLWPLRQYHRMTSRYGKTNKSWPQ
ncbi:hypothetical protein scyTo_0000978 [Scyliorhinus torazame]|uniref:Uncharacterized protein n=1 Tax=Scyliorhinus torazame TaxID=75743 RepID=A0A401P781_SCYTO|nr:hypothetical protein [Scyliorhinus torazame]